MSHSTRTTTTSGTPTIYDVGKIEQMAAFAKRENSENKEEIDRHSTYLSYAMNQASYTDEGYFRDGGNAGPGTVGPAMNNTNFSVFGMAIAPTIDWNTELIQQLITTSAGVLSTAGIATLSTLKSLTGPGIVMSIFFGSTLHTVTADEEALLLSESEAIRRAEESTEGADRGREPGPTVDENTGEEVGRFIGDEKGNIMVEPKGGSTVPAGKGGIDTHTRYPNGSNYHRYNPNGHPPKSTSPHGHGHLEGTGPGMSGQGPSIDVNGNVVPWNSPGAHWQIR